MYLPFISHKSYYVFIFTVPPHINHFDFPSKSKKAGDSTSLSCTVDKGDNPIQFEWFQNSKPILNTNEGISIGRFGDKISILGIDSLRAEHSGKYTCKATNFAGSAYYSAILLVNGE